MSVKQPNKSSETTKAARTRTTAQQHATPTLSPAQLNQALADPETASPQTLLQLQRTHGNRAVQRLIQTKLTVGPAHDRYEQEADQMAEAVMSAPAPTAAPAVQRAGEEDEMQMKPLAAGITPLVQREAAPEEEEVQAQFLQREAAPEEEEEVQAQFLQREAAPEEEEVQAQFLQREAAPEEEEEVQAQFLQREATPGGKAFDPGADFESRLAQQKGGQALPDETRAAMESRFGADFSGVRVHTDSAAVQLNREVSAQAFTHGSDIYFNAGKYDPASGAGQRLLAHELTHTIQQGAAARMSGVQREALVQREGDDDEDDVEIGDLEEEADPEDAVVDTRKAGEATGSKHFGSGEEQVSDVYDGTTSTTKKEKHEGFAGAEFALKRISVANDEMVREAVDFMARAGVFGESSRSFVSERDSGVKVSGEGSAKGGIGAEVGARASKTQTMNPDVPGLIEAISYLAKAHAQVGVWGELEGKLGVEYGELGIEVAGKLKGFAGAVAEVGGQLKIDMIAKSISLVGKARAMAGAEGSAEASVTAKVGDMALTAKIEGEGFAGAKAEVGGELSIGLDGIAISGKAEAFAGVSASAKGSGSFEYKGRKLFSASGKVEVEAGVGGKVSGTFEFKGGKLKIGGELAAALGIGGGLGFEAEIDFVAIKDALVDLITSAFAGKNKSEEPIDRSSPGTPPMPLPPAKAKEVNNQMYAAVINDFAAYAAKKRKQGAHTVKREKVQAILDKRVLKNKVLKEVVNSDAANQGLERAARVAFFGTLRGIIIQAGILRNFDVIPKTKS